MSIDGIKERISRADPLVTDVAIAVALTAVVCLQIWLLDATRPPFIRFRDGLPANHGVLPYVVAATVFVPLSLRRKIPWLALLVSGAAALFYELSRFPVAFTVIGPMIALYSVAAYAHTRRTTLIMLLLAGLAVAVPAFIFSNVQLVVQTTGLFVILATAAFMGDTTRSRRAYIEEVEQRAAEAERTREEEALRRVDEERIRIAREVHDIVAHSLSIAAVQASAATTLLDTQPDRARESMEHVRATSKQALSELRSMLDVLRTGEAEPPLTPATDLTRLDRLVQPVRDAGFRVELETDGTDLAAVPAFASVSAYRIVQEALTNTVRHSGGDSVRLTLRTEGPRLVIEALDNGAGSGEPGVPPTSGHGIRGMRERVIALGGTFEAGPTREGFRVFASIPLRSTA